MEKVSLRELWYGRQRLINEESELYQTIKSHQESLQLLIDEDLRESMVSQLRREINDYIAFVLELLPNSPQFKGGHWLCDTIGRKLCENTTSYSLDTEVLHNDDGASFTLIEVHSGLFTTNIFAINLASALNIASDVHVAFLNKKNLED